MKKRSKKKNDRKIIKSIKKLRVGSGDVVVLSVDPETYESYSKNLSDQLKQLFPNNCSIVIDKNRADLKILSNKMYSSCDCTKRDDGLSITQLHEMLISACNNSTTDDEILVSACDNEAISTDQLRQLFGNIQDTKIRGYRMMSEKCEVRCKSTGLSKREETNLRLSGVTPGREYVVNEVEVFQDRFDIGIKEDDFCEQNWFNSSYFEIV